MDGRIFHLKRRLNDYLHDSWTTEKMAKETGLSQSHLLRLFKLHIGQPPASFLKETRLEKARELLEDTFLQIKEIRHRVGLTDDAHFTRDFKKKYGLTPTEHRRQHWKQIYAEETIGKKR